MDDRSQEYRKTIAELREKIESQNQETFDLLKYFDLVIIDTKDDMRIMNSSGAVEELFGEAEKFFERGNSLIKAIYKVTKNTKPRPEEDDDEYRHTQIQLDLEELVVKFVMSSREEREFKIVGEKENGDVFLLVWKIKRMGKIFRSYFKIIPTNSIIKSMQLKHQKEMEQVKSDMRLVFEHIQDGITILDMKNTILYMNEAARNQYFTSTNKVTKNANFEGRLFQEIFVNESADLVKGILNHNKRVIDTREHFDYTIKIAEQDVSFHLKPIFNEREFIIGILIISRNSAGDFNIDTNKLFSALKNLSIENKKLYSANKELESNLNKSNENLTNFQRTIKLIYSFLEQFPYAVSILKMPNMNYEFVNSRYETITQMKREYLRGKRDEEIFPPELVERLSHFINTTLADSSSEYFEFNEYRIRQTVLKNERHEPIYIIRAFE